jgi:Domain of unknown function (DUF202)
MIRGYSDHAANERTFLAWVRTGIAVIAFGFVIEKFNLFVLKFNLFVLTIAAKANSLDAGRRLQLERLSGPFAVTMGFSSSFSELPWLWSQPRALSVPASYSMTRKHIRPVASAQSCSCRQHWR